MFTTEIDTHCQINAPESRSWNVFRTKTIAASSAPAPARHNPLAWLWILPVIATIAVILLATGSLASTHSHTNELAYDQPIPEVIIEGRRMSAQEKLDFDLAPDHIGRVEIVGKRITRQPGTGESK